MAFEEANDTIAPERSIFNEKQDYKSFLRIHVPIFWNLDVRGGRKLITNTHTCTRDNYYNPHCARMLKIN